MRRRHGVDRRRFRFGTRAVGRGGFGTLQKPPFEPVDQRIQIEIGIGHGLIRCPIAMVLRSKRVLLAIRRFGPCRRNGVAGIHLRR